jgi:hypothetical protein
MSFKDPLAQNTDSGLPFTPAYAKGNNVGWKSEGWKTDSPSNSSPFPITAVATMLLSIVLAPTVRIHGAPLTKDPSEGPEFPAAQLTKIPFWVAANAPMAVLSLKNGGGLVRPRDIESKTRNPLSGNTVPKDTH